WAKRFDRVLKDVFEVQDEITEEVVTTLEVKLATGEQARIWRKSLKNPEAREIYYRARDNFHVLSKESVKQARELFSQVIEAEPDSPLGYAYLAVTHWYDAFRGWSPSPEQSLKTSEELVNKALALDENNAEAHGCLAVNHLIKREYDQAIVEGERAVALGPNISDGLIYTGMIYYFSGRFDEALAMINRGMRLCPIYPPFYLALLGQTLNLLERYDEAIGAYQQSADLEPEYPTPHFGLAVVYGALGQTEAAQRAAEAFHRASPNLTSLQEYARRHPFKDPAYNQRWIDALKKAEIE
ncbi:MAG: tetratricopeptide repeat protein, partial [SAR324 cluster bacterium]|nr:tetratricopeptide repeat protein [SAR324 cluster bacterium]